MTRIADVLELLTTQHEEIDRLVTLVAETSDVEDRYRLLDGLATKLTTHLAIEQELLYPELGGIVEPDVIREVLVEHGEIKRILADLVWLEPAGKHFETRLAMLKQLLSGHSAYQEHDLFVQVAERFCPVRLAAICETVHAWSDPPAFAVQAA